MFQFPHEKRSSLSLPDNVQRTPTAEDYIRGMRINIGKEVLARLAASDYAMATQLAIDELAAFRAKYPEDSELPGLSVRPNCQQVATFAVQYTDALLVALGVIQPLQAPAS